MGKQTNLLLHRNTHVDEHNPIWSAALPCEHCYWALVDQNLNDGSSLTADAASFIVEHYAPITAEQLAVDSIVLPHQRLLICAMERSTLESYINKFYEEYGQEPWAAHPLHTPSFLTHYGYTHEESIGKLNLLQGNFLAPPLKRWRQRLLISMGIVVSILLLFYWIGVSKRLSSFDIAQQKIASIYNNALLDSGVQHKQELQQKAAHLRIQLKTLNNEATRLSAVTVIDGILRYWPQQKQLELHDITLNGSHIFINFATPNIPKALAVKQSIQKFCDELQSTSSLPWRVNEPKQQSASSSLWTLECTYKEHR